MSRVRDEARIAVELASSRVQRSRMQMFCDSTNQESADVVSVRTTKNPTCMMTEAMPDVYLAERQRAPMEEHTQAPSRSIGARMGSVTWETRPDRRD